MNLHIFKWAVVPLTAFLLAGLVTDKLFLAKKGLETERFQEAMRDSLKKLEAGDREGGLRGLVHAGQLAPGNLAEQAGLVGKLQAMKEDKKAAELIERSLRAGPKESQTVTNYARLSEYFLESGDIEGAKRILREHLLLKWPDSLHTVFIQGEIALQEAQDRAGIEAAMRHFEKAAALDPGHLPTQVQLGIGFWRLGESRQAESFLRGALEKLPRDPIVLFHLGEVLRQQGKSAEAEQFLAQHKRIRDLEQRRQHLETQFSLRQHQPRDLHEIGVICEQLGQPAKAAAFLRLYLKAKPTDAVAQRDLARVCQEMGDLEGAHVASELAAALGVAR